MEIGSTERKSVCVWGGQTYEVRKLGRGGDIWSKLIKLLRFRSQSTGTSRSRVE